MCRDIKALFNFEPPVSDEEIRGGALQFVRKVSGFRMPSMVNDLSSFLSFDLPSLQSSGLIHLILS